MEQQKYLNSKNFYLTIYQLIELQKFYTNHRKIKIYDQMKFQKLIVIARIITLEPFLTLTDQTSTLNTVIPRSWSQKVNLQLNKYYRFTFSTQNQVRIEDRSYNICIKVVNPILNANQITEHISNIIIQKELRMIYALQKKQNEIQEQSKQEKQRQKQITKQIVKKWCKQVNTFIEGDIFRNFKNIETALLMQTIQNLCDSTHILDCVTYYEWNPMREQSKQFK